VQPTEDATGKVLTGSGRDFARISERDFMRHVRQLPSHSSNRLAFMTERHKQVREYVVRELRENQSMTPERIGAALGLQTSTVIGLLDDLERNLFFLVRAEDGAVTWAFPVTIERTPHRLTFSTGERLYAA
jgi:hypothetical protein